jgi:hypothetical protein
MVDRTGYCGNDGRRSGACSYVGHFCSVLEVGMFANHIGYNRCYAMTASVCPGGGRKWKLS